MDKQIYLDHAASTPVAHQVLEEMLPYFSDIPGNASSILHTSGLKAKAAVEKARGEVADLLDCKPECIVFTSGATESLNLALTSVFHNYKRKGKHIITSKIEHKAVLETCKHLENQGANISYLPVDKEGMISIEELKNSIRKDTILVCLMHGNNEVGVINPINRIGEICRENGLLFMSDATQSAGHISVNPVDSGIHLLCLSGHKINGPKGAGALYYSRTKPPVSLRPVLHGGGQEDGIRGGSYNVPGIVGLGAAAKLARIRINQKQSEIEALRNKFEKMLKNNISGLQIHSKSENRLPHISSISIPDFSSRDFMMKHPNIALSSGSACQSKLNTPSHVLKAMGYSDSHALGTLRVSIGMETSWTDLEFLSNKLHYFIESR